MLLTKNGMNLVDLHVYVDGSAALLTDRLYDFTYAEKTPDFPLPFTYPPFAALVFFPLHYFPFTVIAVLWLLAIVVALAMPALAQRYDPCHTPRPSTQSPA